MHGDFAKNGMTGATREGSWRILPNRAAKAALFNLNGGVIVESDTTANRESVKSLLRMGRRGMVVAAQLALIVLIYYAGSLASDLLPLDVPGNIVGMALLLGCLLTGVLKAKHVSEGCRFLVDNMSLFFIPAGVAIMGCAGMLAGSVLKFAFVCFATTVIVFLATSSTVVAVSRILEKRDAVRSEGKVL